MKLYKTFTSIIAFLLLTSCSVFEKNRSEQNELAYMKNIEDVAIEVSKKQYVNLLQPGDRLIILVSAQDQDVVKVFNQNYSATEQFRESSVPRGNIISNSQPINGPTYIIDGDGFIDFPVLGKIEAAGMSLDHLKQYITSSLKRYIKEPYVQARITNYRITVLGEVRNPGQFTIADGTATVLNAIGMAGDLTIYGKRDDILIVRNVNGLISKERIDLTDAGFIDSPYYFLKQGDIIYVTPNKTQERLAKRDPNSALYISIASIVVTIIALIVRK
ncbi:polysaccharide biosynthesis/export family protein [Planobacterium oryzisoli]|uniref:Polysaccharide biosynthesis/export family protein n=1 Tax=Planobacterium oryzisoli TaxID=2771435 RepID=A0A930YVK6_9FLAO|nr:polysaccharide biosynthesis/export family protein [Planobacterium oryzisoli]MBF5027139.1 polysaccharide biosynthesis/export family protein [Planobacterium oryzisoli]